MEVRKLFFDSSVRGNMASSGVPVQEHVRLLKNKQPNIVIGTPGRIKDLAERGDLDLSHVKYFVLDECDKMLESTGVILPISICIGCNLLCAQACDRMCSEFS